ncbi:MAG: hypothetical protein M3R36_00165 [Bacteroidota bacterium]|nr:hypothetical protein [Bacteroidota bacterium]
MAQKQFLKNKSRKLSNKSGAEETNRYEDESMKVSVFTTNNNALFQFAKSFLDNYKIKYTSTGNFLNTLNSAVYSAEIKIYKKDEKASRKLLSELEPSPGPRLKLSAREFLHLAIIVLSIAIMIVIFSVFKYYLPNLFSVLL